ncbi:MAG: hypothetical protein N2318_00455 [Meiothermus sp.]|nr:hypothetical protein [Meiothermus sp.]
MLGALAFVSTFALLVTLVLLTGLALLEGLATDLGAVLSGVLVGLSDLEVVLLFGAVLLLAALALAEEVAFPMVGGFFALALETVVLVPCWLLPV